MNALRLPARTKPASRPHLPGGKRDHRADRAGRSPRRRAIHAGIPRDQSGMHGSGLFVARINSRAQSAPRSDIYGRRTYSGRPSSSMRFSVAMAMATSVICRPSVRERSASPITRL